MRDEAVMGSSFPIKMLVILGLIMTLFNVEKFYVRRALALYFMNNK